MISARSNLAIYIASLSEEEAEEALDLLQQRFDPLPSPSTTGPRCREVARGRLCDVGPLPSPSTTGPPCPACGESDLDNLVWFDDKDVGCETCGHVWAPNTAHAVPR